MPGEEHRSGTTRWEEFTMSKDTTAQRVRNRSLGIRQLDFVTIYTKNLAASCEFYLGRLEFSLIREVPGEFFQMEVGGVPICVDLDTARTCQNNFGLVVEDLAATETALRERGLSVRSGSNPDSKEHWLSVEDPDGNEVIFLIRRPG